MSEEEARAAHAEGKKVTVVKSKQVVSMALLGGAINRLGILQHALSEAMKQVPGADYIEISVLRYDVEEEENDEATADGVG